MVFFFLMLHLLPLANLIGVTGRGRIAGGVILVSLIPVGLAIAYVAQGLESRAWTILDYLVGAYLTISVLSAVMYLNGGNPSEIRAYLYGLYHFALPVACYFAVRFLPGREVQRIVVAVVLLNSFAVGFGIYLQLARPVYYHAWLTQHSLAEAGLTEMWQYFGRMQSYIGSTSIATVAAATVALAMTLPRRYRWLATLSVPLCVIGSLMSLQRGGIAAMFLAIAVYLAVRRTPRTAKVLATAGIVTILVFGLMRFQDQTAVIGARVAERLTVDMIDAVAGLPTERGYGPGMRYLAEYPLGVGLGATSSAAEIAGLARWGQVVDANFMRIAAELGFFGLLIFLVLIGVAIRSALLTSLPLQRVVFLFVFIVVMIGTNTLDSFYVSHLFWFGIGVIETARLHARSAVAARRVAPTYHLEALRTV